MNLKLSPNEKQIEKTIKIIKIVFYKGFALFMAGLTLYTIFGMSYQVGFIFKNEDLGNITLNNLTGITYGLMMSGIIFISIASIIFLISTLFSHWIKYSLNQILWLCGIFIFFFGTILFVSGQGYFASKNELDQLTIDTEITITIVISVGTLIAAAIWFINFKIESGLRLQGDIKIQQVNPKFRLFLFITFSWYASIIPFVLPFCILSLISNTNNHSFVWTILILFCGIIPLPIQQIFIIRVGIKYWPKDLYNQYVQNNSYQLEKLENIEVTNVTQFFDTIPICNEVYRKKEKFENRTKKEFKKISLIEIGANRLVVNGKVNNSAFSWGIVTKMKKNNLKVFFLSILYFGPGVGLFAGLFPKLFTDASPTTGSFNWYAWGGTYSKLGGLDLFPHNVGRINSENYLIFAARLQTRNDSLTLIPKNDSPQPSNASDQYEWSTNLSDDQKNKLQTLIQEMSFLPSIYIYQDNISIVMKKYHYNEKDNNELQTWELLKNRDSNSDVQFNYLNNAIKIYNIFNDKD